MAETADRPKDAEEIIALKTQLEGDGMERHSHYDTIIEASHGNYYDRVMQSTWQKWQGVVYEPTAEMSDRRQVHVVLNLLNPIVEAKRALWSVVPQVRVPYRSLDDADVQMSDTLETVYRGLWNRARMPEKLGDGGWYAALLGTAVFCVYPDLVNHRPVPIVRSPYGFYGVPGNIEQDGTEWKQVIFVTKMRGRQANQMWPGNSFSPSDMVDVIEYWDEEQKFTMVQQGAVMVVPPILNKLGKVPVVTVPNIAQPGQWWGKGDVEDAIPVINELNKRFNVENQAFSDQAGAPWEAISADMDPDDVSLDPDAINFFQSGGGMKKSSTGGLPWQIYQSNQQLRQYIDSVTDFPEVMKSMWGGSNVSGKAINNMMGPVQARMELRQRYLYPRLQVLNEMAMETWAAYWGGETHVLRGSEKGKRYNVEFRPDDFEGYFENEIYLDSSAYFDVSSKVVIGLQMVAANGCSIKTFIEKLNPFTDDYTQEIEQIRLEQQERIQLAMAATMAAQSPATGFNPDVGQAPTDQMALGKGLETGANPIGPPPGVSPEMLEEGLGEAQMLGGQLPQDMDTELTGAMGRGGETTPLEGGGLLYNLADVIRSTPNVKGRVFLSGSILQGSIGMEGIEIWFTDMTDWATVRQHTSKQLPETKGQFSEPQQGVPGIPYLEVTPGSEGYDVQQPEELAPLEPVPGTAFPEGVDATMAGPAGMPTMMPPPEV